MELKTRYQYTYFIHTYVIKKNRYTKYLSTLLKDKRFNLKIFQKDKDLDLYTYFLPKIRNFMFKTLDFNKSKISKFNNLEIEMQAAILSEHPCTVFEYNLKSDIQGKTLEENSIFFKIEKIQLICFNTGICFMCFKTNLDGNNNFSDVLNFNYKFRDINQEMLNLKKYDNIKVQTDSFADIQEIKDFIKNITGPNFDALKIDLDVERFYTYSYVCIEQRFWNNENTFDKIENDFLKYVYMFPSDNSTSMGKNESVKIINKDNYVKIGISKLGINLLGSDVDLNSYTVLPQEYENQYFYTYILSLYLKVYLKKLNYDFRTGNNINNTRKKFISFTKGLWIQEITNEDMGSLFYRSLQKTLEIDELYQEARNQYDILNIEKDSRKTTVISLILVITLIFNIINFIIT